MYTQDVNKEKRMRLKWLKSKKSGLPLNRVFVVARHGPVTELAKLAAALKKVAIKRKLKVEILASTEPCALQSARIIAQQLDLKDAVMPHECFRADGAQVGDCELAAKIVEVLFRDGVLLLLVSNVYMAHRLMRYAAAKEGYDAKMGEEVRRGGGLMLAKKGVSVIPRQ